MEWPQCCHDGTSWWYVCFLYASFGRPSRIKSLRKPVCVERILLDKATRWWWEMHHMDTYWGPVGEVIIMTSHDDTLQEKVIGQILEFTKILGILYDFLVASHCLGLLRKYGVFSYLPLSSHMFSPSWIYSHLKVLAIGNVVLVTVHLFNLYGRYLLSNYMVISWGVRKAARPLQHGQEITVCENQQILWSITSRFGLGKSGK